MTSNQVNDLNIGAKSKTLGGVSQEAFDLMITGTKEYVYMQLLS